MTRNTLWISRGLVACRLAGEYAAWSKEVEMAKSLPPDLSHLSGREVERVAAALSSGGLEAVLSRRDEIIALQTDEIQKLADLAGAARANCGGFGCG
jgi:hypothetical protein